MCDSSGAQCGDTRLESQLPPYGPTGWLGGPLSSSGVCVRQTWPAVPGHRGQWRRCWSQPRAVHVLGGGRARLLPPPTGWEAQQPFHQELFSARWGPQTAGWAPACHAPSRPRGAGPGASSGVADAGSDGWAGRRLMSPWCGIPGGCSGVFRGRELMHARWQQSWVCGFLLGGSLAPSWGLVATADSGP